MEQKKLTKLLAEASSGNPNALEQFRQYASEGSFTQENISHIHNEPIDTMDDKSAAYMHYMRGFLYSVDVNPINTEGELSTSDKAKKLFELASSKNCSDAKVDLAEIYIRDDQPETALDLLDEAIALKDARAMLVRGQFYWEGYGTAVDKDKAYELFEEATQINPAEGYYTYAVLLENEGDYENAAIAYDEGIKLGDPRAMFKRGCLYERGQDTERNYSKAWALFEKAANLGSPEAENYVQENQNLINDVMPRISKAIAIFKNDINTSKDTQNPEAHQKAQEVLQEIQGLMRNYLNILNHESDLKVRLDAGVQFKEACKSVIIKAKPDMGMDVSLGKKLENLWIGLKNAIIEIGNLFGGKNTLFEYNNKSKLTEAAEKAESKLFKP